MQPGLSFFSVPGYWHMVNHTLGTWPFLLKTGIDSIRAASGLLQLPSRQPLPGNWHPSFVRRCNGCGICFIKLFP
jgi:hypothetical protein